MTARRRRNEAGYVAVLVALLASSVFLGLAALGVDVSRWYMEGERLQKAADAAALAGVTYMPANFPLATTRATAVAAKNGYVPKADGSTAVVVSRTTSGSQLRVSIAQRVPNAFASSFGVSSSVIERTSVADYVPPTPIGSPCNAFGNEPPSQATNTNQVQPVGQPATGSALPSPLPSNCKSLPQLWAGIEGPATDKVQGDRFQTIPCAAPVSPSAATINCTGGKNDDYRDEGYFFAVHVDAMAAGQNINVQIYDPAYIYTTIRCAPLPKAAAVADNNLNDYAQTDAQNRYSAYEQTTTSNGNTTVSYRNTNAQQYCSGDYNPGFSSSASDSPTTSFVLREQVNEGDPQLAAPVTGCTKQFVGRGAVPTQAELTKTDGGYNKQLARVFHQWVPLCTIPNARAGDYLLQVRTNVTAAGTAVANNGSNAAIVYSGNSAAAAPTGNTTTGTGLNAFSIRAVPNDDTKRQYIAVSGTGDLPLIQNASATTATFNLVRALPNARDKKLYFEFYDAADGSGADGGTIRVVRPTDATGSIASQGNIAGCLYSTNASTPAAATDCTAKVTSTANNGQTGIMTIPLPHDYNCDTTRLAGCWFQVEITFTGNVTDFTTWTAKLVGDPVRIVE